MNAYAWVRFVASIGVDETPSLFLPYVCYADPEYGDTKAPCYHQTASGVVYADYANQRPTQGILEAESLLVDDLLKGVWVSHGADQQIYALRNQQYPVRHNLKSVLEEKPTVVSLDLLDLTTQDVVEHTIFLETVGAWTPPCQVQLSRKAS